MGTQWFDASNIDGRSPRTIRKWTHYLPIYHRHLERFRARDVPVVLLEVGVADGGSHDMWQNYFGKERVQIIGVDNDPAVMRHEMPMHGRDQTIWAVRVFIGDQGNRSFWRHEVFPALRDALGGRSIDIVVDDGSHLAADQIATFEEVYQTMSEDGVYIVEDLMCAFMPYFNDWTSRRDFFRYAKRLLDEVVAFSACGKLPVTPITASTNSVH